jgi:diguanylate cyclase (GGDEF)-like protein
VNLIDDRTVEGLVVTASDITDLAEARSRLAHLATHDPLTGLANRSLLFDRLAHALEGARRRSSMVSLVFCDVDGFKRVNDGHGHRGGDHVLVEIARRLDAVARASDTVARIGGDEFVLLLEGGDREGAAALVERIEAAMAEPIVLPNGSEVVVRLSVGSATDLGGLVADDLLDRADAAMYLSKDYDEANVRRNPHL